MAKFTIDYSQGPNDLKGKISLTVDEETRAKLSRFAVSDPVRFSLYSAHLLRYRVPASTADQLHRCEFLFSTNLVDSGKMSFEGSVREMELLRNRLNSSGVKEILNSITSASQYPY